MLSKIFQSSRLSHPEMAAGLACSVPQFTWSEAATTQVEGGPFPGLGLSVPGETYQRNLFLECPLPPEGVRSEENLKTRRLLPGQSEWVLGPLQRLGPHAAQSQGLDWTPGSETCSREAAECSGKVQPHWPRPHEVSPPIWGCRHGGPRAVMSGPGCC